MFHSSTFSFVAVDILTLNLHIVNIYAIIITNKKGCLMAPLNLSVSYVFAEVESVAV